MNTYYSQNLEAQLQKQNEIINKQAEAMAEQAAINSKHSDRLQKQSEVIVVLELENQVEYHYIITCDIAILVCTSFLYGLANSIYLHRTFKYYILHSHTDFEELLN